jgi:uncharacterized membrane protein YccF (DUF307 family)
MNDLSLLIYLAEVSGSLQTALTLVLFALVVFGAIVTAVRAITHAANYGSYDKKYHPEKYEAAHLFLTEKQYLPRPRWLLLMTVMLLAIVAIPSRQTIYLIAGSEIGERVIQSDEARGIYDDISAVIRSYAAPKEKAE